MNMYLTLQNPIIRVQNALKIGWTVILFIALWLGISLSVWAQPQYGFTAVSGTFTPITGGVDVDNIEADGVISANIPIGFSFVFDGIAYTQVKASSDGFLTFNTAATNSLTNALNTTAATRRPLLAPLWDDLDGSATGGSKASYLTSGTAPNRIFTMEWLNWEWNWLSSTPVISFQVKLYESTGIIEYVYNQESGAVNSGTASIGMSGATTGSYLSLNNTSASPTASSTSETTTLSTKPATGQIYRWSPTFTPVRTLSPADNATGVALNNNPVINFAYPATPPTIGTGTIELRKTTGGTLVESFVLPSPHVTIVGNGVMIDPTISLECNTEYYLTVPATAIGGVGFAGITTTTAWSFTTGAPIATPIPSTEYVASTGLPIAIPTTAPPNVITNTQTITATNTINNNLSVFVDITHTWAGDLTLSLTHVASSTTVQLIVQRGGSADNIVTTFSDAAAASITTGTPPYTGSFRPEQPLSGFNGLSLNSDWKLTVDDGANGDGGSLNGWKVIYTPIATDIISAFVFSPLNGATNVAQSSNLVLNFDFPIQAGTGNIEIVNTATNAVLETIPVGDARVDYSTVAQVTINPTTDFPAGAVVAVRFPTGAFKSCNNIDVIGITNTTTWRFTVEDPCAGLTVGAGPDQTGVVSGSNVTLAGVAATGGSGNYTYAWTPAANLNDPTILAPVASNVIASTIYTLTVTDVTTTCTKSSTVFISLAAPAGGGGGGGSTSTVTAPTLRITGRSATTMALSWTGGSNAEGYTIFRKGATSNTFVRVRDVAVTASTFLDSLLRPNTQYSYYVQAIRGGTTANSNIVSDFTYPSVPTIASFQNACVGTGAQLTIKGSTGVYNVYSAATGGTAVATGDSTHVITTPTFADSTTFYVSAIGTRYESTPRVAVRVITRPLPTAAMLGAALQESCTDSLTIMAEAVDGATYTWYSSDAPVATTSVPMYTVNRSGVYSVLVNKDGCVARSSTIRVRVNRVSPAQIRSVSSVQFCETGILQAVETEGASYEWQLGSVVVGNGSTLTVTQSGSYTVTVTSVLGCVLTSTPVTVTVINVPQLDLQSSAPDFCEGTEGVELTVNTVNGAVYEWYRNGRKIRTTSTPALQVNVGAEYRVRVILNGTCSRISDPVMVTRNAAPAASARVYGDSIKVVYNGTVAITSVEWTKDDAPFAVTTQAFAPTESGIYRATVTYETGCQVVSAAVEYIKRPEPPIVTGEEEVEALGFMLFPNPTANKVNLTFGDAFKGEITLTLTDAIGRTIQVVKVKANENATLDLSTLANGNYMLTIASNDKVVTRKIIRE